MLDRAKLFRVEEAGKPADLSGGTCHEGMGKIRIFGGHGGEKSAQRFGRDDSVVVQDPEMRQARR